LTQIKRNPRNNLELMVQPIAGEARGDGPYELMRKPERSIRLSEAAAKQLKREITMCPTSWKWSGPEWLKNSNSPPAK
jgi:hypothetical protein